MKFVWATIMVDNMEASLKFYQEIVGLELRRRFSPTEGKELAFLGEPQGETEIELVYDGVLRGSSRDVGITLGFRANSLEDTMMAIKAVHLPIKTEITQANPQLKFFFAFDPNGICVQFSEEV